MIENTLAHIGYKKLDSSGGQNKPFSKHSYFSTRNSVKANAQENPVTSASKPPIDEKLNSLLNYRKARGSYFKCGAKWGPQHKCQASIPLHLVEEVWQLLAESPSASAAQSESDDDDDELLALSEHAVRGTTAAHTLKFSAFVQNLPSIILVDSGSSHNFIRQHLASQLSMDSLS